jgi:hypothetical protein
LKVEARRSLRFGTLRLLTKDGLPGVGEFLVAASGSFTEVAEPDAAVLRHKPVPGRRISPFSLAM